MKRILGLLFLLGQFVHSFAQYSVDGTVYAYPVSAGSGIQAVYIANGLSAITISYTADNGKSIHWYSYKQSLADKVPVNPSLVNAANNGSTTTYSISAPEDATGYLVEEDGALKAPLPSAAADGWPWQQLPGWADPRPARPHRHCSCRG